MCVVGQSGKVKPCRASKINNHGIYPTSDVPASRLCFRVLWLIRARYVVEGEMQR